MKNEKFILYLLTFIWFCAIVDFLLMLPLGTELMHLYHIQPREYSMLIFAFSLSGGISAFMAAFYIDSYDRKTVLLTAVDVVRQKLAQALSLLGIEVPEKM